MAVATATIIATAAVLAVVGAGVGAYASIQQGEAAKKAAEYNAAVARNNSLMQRQQAQLAAAQVRRRNLKVLGAEQTAFAKSGVTIGGSAVDVLYDSAVQGEMDRLTALYTGKVESGRSEAGARLLDMQGSNALTSSYYNAGSTILSGAGAAAGYSADYAKIKAGA